MCASYPIPLACGIASAGLDQEMPGASFMGDTLAGMVKASSTLNDTYNNEQSHRPAYAEYAQGGTLLFLDTVLNYRLEMLFIFIHLFLLLCLIDDDVIVSRQD